MLWWYFPAMNLLAFTLFGVDKCRARTGGWRVRERTLLLVAALGGSAGAILGMWGFHHKTCHRRFTLGLPAILAIHLLVLVWLLGR